MVNFANKWSMCPSLSNNFIQNSINVTNIYVQKVVTSAFFGEKKTEYFLSFIIQIQL